AVLTVNCGFVLSPTNTLFGAGAGESNVTVTSLGLCDWTTTNTNSWITILDDSGQGIGGGTVSFAVASNATDQARTGTLTIAGRTFTVKQSSRDRIKPQVTILAPIAGARVTNGLVTLRGTAKDEAGVARVEYWVDNGPPLMATGTVNWAAQLELAPG